MSVNPESWLLLVYSTHLYTIYLIDCIDFQWLCLCNKMSLFLWQQVYRSVERLTRWPNLYWFRVATDNFPKSVHLFYCFKRHLLINYHSKNCDIWVVSTWNCKICCDSYFTGHLTCINLLDYTSTIIAWQCVFTTLLNITSLI